MILVALLTLLSQDEGGWTEVRFNRVHLHNGNFIDGRLVRDVPQAVTLLIKSGEMVIRRDQIDRVEFVTIRSRTEPPKQIKTPDRPATNPNRPPVGPVGPVGPLASEDVKKRIDALLKDLVVAPSESKRLAVEDLRPLGEEGAVYLASKLRSVPSHSQGAVATCLGLLKVPATVPALEALAAEPDAKLRGAGLMALGYMGDAEKVRYLRPALKDPDPEIRGLVLSLLSEVEHKDWFEPVGALCGDRDAIVRKAALSLSGRIARANQLGEEYRRLIAEAIRGADDAGRVDLANLLGGMGDKSSWSLLTPLLSESSPKLRFAASRALMQLSAPDSAPDVLVAMDREDDPKVRVFLAGTCQKLRLRKAVPTLVRWLGERDEDLKKVAHQALVGITGQPIPVDAEKWAEWAGRQTDLR